MIVNDEKLTKREKFDMIKMRAMQIEVKAKLDEYLLIKTERGELD